jgi:hypothetical protein
MIAGSVDMLERKIPMNQKEAPSTRFIRVVSGRLDSVPA